MIFQLLIAQNVSLILIFIISFVDHVLMDIMVDKLIGPANYAMKIVLFVMDLILLIVQLAKNPQNGLNTHF